ncbi:MAG: helix-turn-helix domain-containing protein [Candidatus Coproplasma sp.]
MAFSENLKTLRKLRGIAQTQLAQALNTSIKTISHWETGYSEPSIDQILALAEFFSITTDELLK